MWRHGRGWMSVGASLERSTLRVDCLAVLAAGGRAQNSPSLCSVLRQLRSTPLRGATLQPLRSSAFQRRAATHPPASMLRRGVVSYSLPSGGGLGRGRVALRWCEGRSARCPSPPVGARASTAVPAAERVDRYTESRGTQVHRRRRCALAAHPCRPTPHIRVGPL